MKDLKKAMKEEQLYIADRMAKKETSLLQRLSKYGYTDLNEYFLDKRNHLFSEWKPEIYRVDGHFLNTQMEKAIINGRYGIYIMDTKKPYAYHGNDEIDYDLCKSLEIETIEMNYSGGTIIGDQQDLGILLVMPKELDLTFNKINQKVLEIIQEYIPDAELNGNDILINDEKIMGSMGRIVGPSIVWAAQISFADHMELINKVCHKKSGKKPCYINNNRLTRGELERRLVKWLQKR